MPGSRANSKGEKEGGARREKTNLNSWSGNGTGFPMNVFK